MLSRVASPSAYRATLASPIAHVQIQKRFASDKAIRVRMEAVNNIKKITSAMKMVASAKLKRCEDALKITRVFSKGVIDLWGPEEAVTAESKAAAAAAAAAAPAGDAAADAKVIIPNSVLVVPITPDRGLCGSVSAQVNRATRARLNKLNADGKKVLIVAYGEKSRASLERNFYRDLVATHTEHSKLKRRTFKQSALLANKLATVPFENAEVLYNSFKNMISFDSRNVKLLSFQQAIADPKLFEPYELEGNSDVLENLYEFTLAIRLHSWLAESDMVEFSQRVNSMGNSSKSAQDMLSRLKLLYNRTRQSRITTELVEIISGASASDDQKEKD